VVAIGGAGAGGVALEISPPNPNPFTAETRVSFTLPSPGLVKYSVHDASGRRVATVLSEPMSAGPHAGAWAGRDDRGVAVPPGLYFGRLEFGGETRTWKMLLVR
jgi:hypothetical protein